MTHVLICVCYKKGSEIETGKIVSTFFLIKRRGYDNSEMSWEPFISIFGFVLENFGLFQRLCGCIRTLVLWPSET